MAEHRLPSPRAIRCSRVRARLGWRTPALLAAIVAALACSRGPAAVSVASVRLAEGALSGPLREAGIDAAALEDAARAGLAGAGFRLEEREGAYRARVDVASVRLAADARGAPQVELELELQLAPTDARGGATARETGLAAVPLAGRAPSAAGRAALSAAALDAARGLAIGFHEEGKPIERVIADLSSDDARLRDHAIRVVAARRSREAVPALVERLRDEEPTLVERAVGALAEIGDPRAVAPLIEAAQGGHPGFTARVVRVVGELGGDEAEGYLLTVEAGHPDARVRRAARESLAALAARRAPATVAEIR
jgi:hypothetical protein